MSQTSENPGTISVNIAPISIYKTDVKLDLFTLTSPFQCCPEILLPMLAR
jgi:hypothetical protein